MKITYITVSALSFFIATSCMHPIANQEKVQEIKSNYSKEELKYFHELVFHTELDNGTTNLNKWDENIYISLFGNYTYQDSIEIEDIIEDINNILIDVNIRYAISAKGNLKISFIDPQKFSDYNRMASNSYHGFFYLKTNRNKIERAHILVNNNLSGDNRMHTIREEITNSLGLINDSYRFSESILYQFMNKNTSFSYIDIKMIQLLYNYGLPYGMKKEEFEKIFLNAEN